MSFPNRISGLQLVIISAVCLLLVAAQGCGSSTNEEANATGQASFDSGMTSIREEKWEEALKQFETVLTSGSVNPDQAGELFAYQALAFAKVGKFEEAAKSLEQAREGADQELVDKIASQIEELKRPQQ